MIAPILAGCFDGSVILAQIVLLCLLPAARSKAARATGSIRRRLQIFIVVVSSENRRMRHGAIENLPGLRAHDKSCERGRCNTVSRHGVAHGRHNL